ncbi:hypothetical protein BH11PSE9_BH11PSE9_10570 [soil metagenome]
MHKLLDIVTLTHDIPNAGLRCGDVGAVVALHGAHAMEIEFVTGSGRTHALLTLGIDDVRRLGDRDTSAGRFAGEADSG